MGQNFLINSDVVNKIIKAGNLSEKDNVLEIGPGLGVLTWRLAESVGKLVVVEKDKNLFNFLEKEIKRYKRYKDIKLFNDDVLKIEAKKFRTVLFPPPTGGFNKISSEHIENNNYKIISNLPYQITSPVLWKFLHEIDLPFKKSLRFSKLPSFVRRGSSKPSEMILMVQKEVAERIISKPGKMSVLSVMCQFYAECEKLFDVSRENFWPSPEVDSAVIKLRVKSKEGGVDEKKFFQIVKVGFSQKRKMLKNNLSNGLKISQAEIILALKNVGLNEKVRAQELSVEDWARLVGKI